jgi:zinc/manganese transport system permease protein
MIELLQPLLTDPKLSRALVACIALVVSGVPMGVFIMLRRMTLVGDGMSHAILPGAALAMLAVGTASLWHMAFGGLIAGLIIAALAGLLQRFTLLKEDASFSGLYLIAMAAGVLIVSDEHDAHALIDLLFGDAMRISASLLTMIVTVATITLLALATLYRGLVIECIDALFLRSVGGRSWVYNQGFMVLMVINLIAGFQTMGTLMALGLMLLPAMAARFWAKNIDSMIAVALIVALPSALIGLLLSHYYHLPAGPTIIMIIGACYVLSIVFGSQGGLLRSYLKHRHYAG